MKYRTDANVAALEPRIGITYEEICAAARELKADLIVLATHGYTGYKRVFLGSTAERVVQHSPCPVLVVRHHLNRWNEAGDLRSRTGFELTKILVPIDFSKYSKTAFKYGLQLTRDFDAELRLVHVINPHAYPFGGQIRRARSYRAHAGNGGRGAKKDAFNGSKSESPIFRPGDSWIAGGPNLQRSK